MVIGYSTVRTLHIMNTVDNSVLMRPFPNADQQVWPRRSLLSARALVCQRLNLRVLIKGAPIIDLTQSMAIIGILWPNCLRCR